MKRLRNCTVAMLCGISAPVLIWVGAGAALYQNRRRTTLLRRAMPSLTGALK